MIKYINEIKETNKGLLTLLRVNEKEIEALEMPLKSSLHYFCDRREREWAIQNLTGGRTNKVFSAPRWVGTKDEVRYDVYDTGVIDIYAKNTGVLVTTFFTSVRFLRWLYEQHDLVPPNNLVEVARKNKRRGFTYL